MLPYAEQWLLKMNSNITLEDLVSYSAVVYYILMSLSSSHGKIHNYTEEYFDSEIPSELSPSCRQTTAASELSQWSSHTVPQTPSEQISTVPNVSFTDTVPPTSLTLVSLHSAKCPKRKGNSISKLMLVASGLCVFGGLRGN